VTRYLAAGVGAVWLIHPAERRIEVSGDTELDAEQLARHLWP
jgi:Uma2 family endonuclease